MIKTLLSLVLAMTFAAAPAAAQDMPGLQVGDLAPDFTANDFRGEKFTLSDHYDEGPVILVFYRGGWCPYCNKHLQSLQARMEDFEKFGARLVAVSVDTVEKAAEPVKGHNLTFDVISNPEGDIIKAYGLSFKVPVEIREKYKEYGIDLKAASGRDDGLIAVPATYIIDEGKIIFAYADEDYTKRATPEQILAALDEWQAGQQPMLLQ